MRTTGKEALHTLRTTKMASKDLKDFEQAVRMPPRPFTARLQRNWGVS